MWVPRLGWAKPIECLRRRITCGQVGRDVVLGFIETHGRVENAALVEGLETMPLREVGYRGFTVKRDGP